MSKHLAEPWKILGTNQIVSEGDFMPGQSWDSPIALLCCNRAESEKPNGLRNRCLAVLAALSGE